jgi:hypothetical protein
MRFDPSTNFTIDEGLSALSRTVDTYYTAAVDHASGNTAAFFISCGTFDTSFVATLQYSDDNSDWTDEPDTTAGNTVSITLTEAGDGTIAVPNPRARYSRLKVAVGGTNVFGVTSILGPLRSIAAE